jgi:tRNA nucleotidyltransferase (CCA-adding enzyme)
MTKRIRIPETAKTILETLTEHGHEAYLVGGFVRDSLLGAKPHDADITASATPDETKHALRDFLVIETGLKHGTVTVIADGETFDITTFRTDGIYSDGRRPDKVTFASSVAEDLARRDFTINAVAADADGNLIDPFGGESDMRNRVVRCVGDAGERFREDALRILRAMRFASTLGFRAEAGTAEAMRAEKGRLANISAERIRAEVEKTLCGKDAVRVLREHADVLAAAVPEIGPMFGFSQRNRHHVFDVWEHTLRVVGNVPADPVFRFAALFHDIGKPGTFTADETGEGHFYGHGKRSREIAGAVISRLKFDNMSRRRILNLVEFHDTPIPQSRKTMIRVLNRFGPDMTRDLLTLKRADILGQSPAHMHRLSLISDAETVLSRVLADKECFSLRDLAVNGRDMTGLGLGGREVGAALKFLLEAVLNGTVPNDKETLVGYCRKNLMS